MERTIDLDPEELEVLSRHLGQRITNALTEIEKNLEILEIVDPEYAKSLRNSFKKDLEALSNGTTNSRKSS